MAHRHVAVLRSWKRRATQADVLLYVIFLLAIFFLLLSYELRMGSLSFLNNEGIIKNTDFRRISGRVRLDQKINKWLSTCRFVALAAPWSPPMY